MGRVWLLVLPAALVALLWWATFARASRIDVGSPAPEFGLPSMSGDQVTLRSLRGKPVLINFWASWCVPCRAEAPDLANTWRRHRDSGVQMIGINTQDLESDAREFIAHYDLGYVNLRDTSGRVSALYGVRAYPESFFISPDGVILEHVYGPMTSGEMASRITRHFSL